MPTCTELADITLSAFLRLRRANRGGGREEGPSRLYALKETFKKHDEDFRGSSWPDFRTYLPTRAMDPANIEQSFDVLDT